MGIYAKRNIDPMEELTFDYGYKETCAPQFYRVEHWANGEKIENTKENCQEAKATSNGL